MRPEYACDSSTGDVIIFLLGVFMHMDPNCRDLFSLYYSFLNTANWAGQFIHLVSLWLQSYTLADALLSQLCCIRPMDCCLRDRSGSGPDVSPVRLKKKRTGQQEMGLWLGRWKEVHTSDLKMACSVSGKCISERRFPTFILQLSAIPKMT